MRLKLISETKLPTEFGEFTLVGFEEIINGNNHIALIYGNVIEKKPILSRIHSECLTGDVFLSMRCDCGSQLRASLMKIVQEGSGVFLYHRQEGRNIGLLNKIRAYSLQDVGFDTVEANLKLGFKSDERDFQICADMYHLLSINRIKLITNNPEKVKMMQHFGIRVVERIPMIVGRNSKNYHYLNTKVKKLGHLL
ncbi:GTP cyclohydrolase II [Candidatus Riesia pediculischaeffi]|uniref:GTP cyclohydrolase-2 n=2 Tax=Candidatus Riesia pediculischaeffi TaxID=428411 RepID=A0A1V0HKH4_9ENTR|nr:GTP cyclohydrolase II [Candidatus Riesia pediculischaeffi]ARC53323.1 GTP cyclohydrolase [Candidatus Riesia pediculischaeffi]KIE63784.1 GTP cyclohydrolase II [Candidatus Riesia pediculischaeffi PTSU]